MRTECGCGRVVEKINDGTDRVIAVECEECMASGGNFSRSSAWVESDRDVSQLDKLGKYKPTELEEPDHRPLKKKKK